MPSKPFAKGHVPADLTRALASNTTADWRVIRLTGTAKLVSPRAAQRRTDSNRPAGNVITGDLLCPRPPEDDSEETARELAEVARAVLRPGEFLQEMGVSSLLTREVTPGNSLSIPPLHKTRVGLYGATSATRDEILRGNVPEPQRFGPPEPVTTPAGMIAAFHQDRPDLLGRFAAMVLDQLRVPRSSLFPALPAEAGFTSYGGAVQIDCLIGAAVQTAMRAAWYEKWQVSRRRRPEELAADPGSLHPIWAEIGEPLLRPFAGCLPMPLAEGCPLHPAYPSGHAVIGGAVGTVKKAFYANSIIQSAAGTASSVHREIDLLIANYGFSRMMMGIHFRSDIIEGIRLGERAALRHLRVAKAESCEPWGSVTFNLFDGQPVTI
jgi:membrane-associated phospholipid phosphatase